LSDTTTAAVIPLERIFHSETQRTALCLPCFQPRPNSQKSAGALLLRSTSDHSSVLSRIACSIDMAILKRDRTARCEAYQLTESRMPC
jgi:hypothetical protein